MDFKTVTSTLLTAFEQGHISYALIGGFAVSLWGYQRATVDIDFLVDSNFWRSRNRCNTEANV